jgi:hypothetical protein
VAKYTPQRALRVYASTNSFDLVFHIERTCPDHALIEGISNGLVMTATGDAAWELVDQYPDPDSSITRDMFERCTLVDVDDIPSDSFLIYGIALTYGLPVIAAEPCFHVILTIDPGEGEICIDSSFIPPGPWWLQH